MSELERFEESIVPYEGPPDAEQTLDLEHGRDLLADDQPEFIIVGIRRPGGVTLFVSKDLIETKFARRIDGYDDVPLGPGERAPVAHVPRIHAIVGVEMTQFQQVLADSYQAGLQTLLELWQRAGYSEVQASE